MKDSGLGGLLVAMPRSSKDFRKMVLNIRQQQMLQVELPFSSINVLLVSKFTTECAAERPAERAVERFAERAAECVAERTAERAAERALERSAFKCWRARAPVESQITMKETHKNDFCNEKAVMHETYQHNRTTSTSLQCRLT